MMLSDAQKAKQGDSAAQASGCYIPAGAHWTRSECWVMLRHPLHLIGYVKFEKFASASNQCMLFAHANCASGNTWDAKMSIGWAWAHGWINGWMKRLQGGAIKEGLNARVEVHHYSFLPNLTCIPVSVCRILSSTFSLAPSPRLSPCQDVESPTVDAATAARAALDAREFSNFVELI